MRYCCPDADRMVDERADYWMPMDQYIGGIEHAVLHLLYARFWTKVMRDMGLVKFDEPFTRLFTQGMLLAECYYREDANGRRRWYYPAEIDVHHDEKGRPTGAVALSDGQPVIFGGTEKMSKSKNNVVEPRDIIERFGADTARAYVMFAGPPADSAVWSDSGAAGVQRFLRKLWTTCHAAAAKAASENNGKQRFAPVDQAALTPKQVAVRRSVHMSLKQALHDYTRVQYNTVVSACMKMLNSIDSGDAQGSTPLVFESFGILLRVLYPIAPHVTHALWAELGFIQQYGDILDAPWPVVDDTALRQEEVEVVVQVNGKLRGRIVLPVDADETLARETALADANVQKFVGGTPVRKVVFVRGKLVNIVI
jgi:leucyl-tRNA synthetase